MSNVGKVYPWFKIYSKGWLTGTIRATLTPAERGVWADLLALASESRVRGVICRAKGIPYEREYLAQLLAIPVELLNSTIYKCSQDENADDPRARIVFDNSECLVVSNWDKYQAVPDRAKVAKEAKVRAKESKKNRVATPPAQLDLSGEAKEILEKHNSLLESVKNLFSGNKERPEEIK